MKDISLHILDIVQNSISARATVIETGLIYDPVARQLKVGIGDNGSGITPDMLGKVTDPFVTSRTTRKVGLGLPLFRQHAEQTGGNFSIESEPGKGTQVTAVFKTTHPDCLPLGDIAGVMVLLIQANPQIRFILHVKNAESQTGFDTKEIQEVLGSIPIETPDIRDGLKGILEETIKELNTAMVISFC